MGRARAGICAVKSENFKSLFCLKVGRTDHIPTFKEAWAEVAELHSAGWIGDENVISRRANRIIICGDGDEVPGVISGALLGVWVGISESGLKSSF